MNERESKREAAIHADVFNPAESDLEYYQRRMRELQRRAKLSASGPCVAAAPTQTRENEANGMTEADMEQSPFQPKQNHA